MTPTFNNAALALTMKYIKFTATVAILSLCSCGQNTQTSKQTIDTTVIAKTEVAAVGKDDEKQIRELVRKMLIWAEHKNSLNLTPIIENKKDSVYTGFDLEILKTNLQTLKATGFFADEFIENYRQIILTLAQKMKGKTWSTGELPPYNFANDSDPWCACQDTPYDNPWDKVQITVINLNGTSGELYWKFARRSTDKSSNIDDFKYKFNVKKEAGKWKIAYLQDFDLAESTKVL